MACDYPFPTCTCCVFNAFHIPVFFKANISHRPSLFPCSCSAYQTSDSGSSTGYVYRMAVEHSLPRRRRSGRSFPGDGVSWHVTILSLHVPAVYSMRFTFQCFLRPTFHIVLLSSHAAVVPTRLLIAAPALGTFTGWRWSILYPGDVGAEDRHLEAV